MRKVELRINEEYKYITIKKLVETNIQRKCLKQRKKSKEKPKQRLKRQRFKKK